MESIDIGTGKIAAALAKAQAEMPNPKFDSQNPHFRSKFASLTSVRNAVVPVLAKHGISMTQNLETTGDWKGIACTTVLRHESGESLSFGPLAMPTEKPNAQGFGSAATYARRYSLMAACGVVGDEDDDANVAVEKPDIHSPAGDARIHADKSKVTRAVNAIAAAVKADDAEKMRKIVTKLLEMPDEYIVVKGQLQSRELDYLDLVADEIAAERRAESGYEVAEEAE